MSNIIQIIVAIILILHGLVHFWYVTLSQKLVEFVPEMGWTGKSWLLTDFLGDSTTRLFASLLYALAAIAFVASGIGIFAQANWSRPALLGSAIFSSVVIILFWDGGTQMLVQKGLVGFLINVVILIMMLLPN